MNEFVEEKNAILNVPTESLPNTADPVEIAERECEAMREKLMYAEKKLATATQKNEALTEELAEKQTALQNANAMAKQWQGNAKNISLQLKKEKEEREKDRKLFDEDRRRFDEALERIREFVSKPCRWPLIIGIGFCVLAILVGVCIDHDLMTCGLGEPLATGLFATGTLFLGVVAERQRLR